MNEAETRSELIDPQLEESGWKTGGDVKVHREFHITAGKIGISGVRAERSIADYVLSYKNVKLAVIEAKSDEEEVGEGVAQAKRDAEKLCLQTSFAANGKQIYQICHKTGKEGIIDRFPTPDELWQRTFESNNEWRDKFNQVPYEDVNGSKDSRYYQEIAVKRAVEAIANDEQRVLLTLATGTGKTFIAFQIAWKLFKSRWNLQRNGKRQPRILFLTDRNILANQAYLDFGAFNDDALVRIRPSEISKKGEVPKNGSVFFTIFQTFMSGKESQKYFEAYERDFFDLVIIDECHRGGANDESTWREILDHFDAAVHLGLTATPRRDVNVDTYDYFGEPVFIYSLKDGIEDGFLTPYKVRRIQTTIDEYLYTPDDDILQGEVEEGHVYTEPEFNKSIVIEERERFRVQEMLKNINQNEKTLVFCANQAHAAMVRNLINQESTSESVDYCVRVTANDGSIGETYLRQFQDNEKTIPTILTTSHKLSTGVDARNVRNIVLMRPIRSMIEFKQIIGRGTRLFEGKNYFTIIDFVNAYHMFNDTEWDGEPIEPPIIIGGEGEDTGTDDPPPDPPDIPDPPPDPPSEPTIKTHVKLSDGKVREFQSMGETYFHVEGKLVNVEGFLKYLFDETELLTLLGDEAKLREAWSNPLTRRELLKRIEQVGCSRDDLLKLQELIKAENSDLFDVLEYIAFTKPTMTREARVAMGEDNIYESLKDPQRKFVEYILSNYIAEGVDELDISNLDKVLTAKYGGLHDAKEELGGLEEIQNLFINFQKHLYQEATPQPS